MAHPAHCLKFAGLGHIAQIGLHQWQGTTGDNSPRDTNASVFVVGPYLSTRLADAAAVSARRTKIAFQGGKYVVSASTPSYLASTVSLAAACLAAGAAGPATF